MESVESVPAPINDDAQEVFHLDMEMPGPAAPAALLRSATPEEVGAAVAGAARAAAAAGAPPSGAPGVTAEAAAALDAAVAEGAAAGAGGAGGVVCCQDVPGYRTLARTR